MTDEKVTTTEAAQQARMSRERLLRRVQAGEIDGQLVAGRWLIDSASLQRFIGQQSR